MKRDQRFFLRVPSKSFRSVVADRFGLEGVIEITGNKKGTFASTKHKGNYSDHSNSLVKFLQITGMRVEGKYTIADLYFKTSTYVS